MTDTANVVYGRLKEAMYLSGHAFGRGGEWLETLLADDAWRTVGPGFSDVNEFLRSIDLSPFALGERPALVRRIKELQPGASVRAIADAVGESKSTVQRDLNPVPNGTPEREQEAPDQHGYAGPVPNGTPEREQETDDIHALLEGEAEPFEEFEDEFPGEAAPESEPKSTRELLAQSDQNDWRTPRKFLIAARAVLGGIDLDPASSLEANETVEAARFFTEDEDGLAQPWKGRVWLNPPYGGNARLFVERLIREYEVGNVTAAITLVNSHPTETAWFQQLFRHTICFVRGRIDFGGPSREVSTNSTHGSAIAYLGHDPGAFAAQFSEFGAVMRRV